MNSMYELLMGLPLFQGVSHARISELIEKIKFHFLKYLENEQLIEKGDSCKQLKFLISGSVKLELTNNNKRIRIFETLSAPNVLGAEYLFGRSTVYPYNVSASPSAGIMQIEKADYLKILKTDTVSFQHAELPVTELSDTHGSGALPYLRQHCRTLCILDNIADTQGCH